MPPSTYYAVLLALVLGVGCGESAEEKVAPKTEAKVKGLAKLTKLRRLHLHGNQLADVNGLEKLTQLTKLNLYYNRALTKAQIAGLQKALPNFEIDSNPTK